MPVERLVVCLANSRKPGGRCIAGIDLQSDGSVRWMRPISARQGAAVAPVERHYFGGVEPRVMDVMCIQLLKPVPKLHQHENWLIDSTQIWLHRGRMSWDDMRRWASHYDDLWLTTDSSSKHGLHNRVGIDNLARITDSLRLIRVTDLHLSLLPANAGSEKQSRVLATFSYKGTTYRLWVTDPEVESLLRSPGVHPRVWPESYLTVSLGEQAPDGYFYKLVAAVIDEKRIKHGR